MLLTACRKNNKERTIKKAGLHHFLLHKNLRLLRSQPPCCLFPRVPAVSTAPPLLSPASPPIGWASPHSAAESVETPPTSRLWQFVPDVTGSVPTRKYGIVTKRLRRCCYGFKAGLLAYISRCLLTPCLLLRDVKRPAVTFQRMDARAGNGERVRPLLLVQ